VVVIQLIGTNVYYLIIYDNFFSFRNKRSVGKTTFQFTRSGSWSLQWEPSQFF